MSSKEQQRLQISLLKWYKIYGRSLPWRAQSSRRDPYKVWLSEIMLQQTKVVTVQRYFDKFLNLWPDFHALAATDLDGVLHAWQGLGYYTRARNLHKCAQLVSREFNGYLPDNEKDLLKLPGIGPYTAAAITAIAFGRVSAPVDGNIARVFSRLMNLHTPLPVLQKEVAQLLVYLVPEKNPGDFVQALMDLGATICMPKKTLCNLCPLAHFCKARKLSLSEYLPIRPTPKKKSTLFGYVFWIKNTKGEVFLRRRPEEGLLGGMMEFPSTKWRKKIWTIDEALEEAPTEAKWCKLSGNVKHTFTHFHLELTVLSGQTDLKQNEVEIWSSPRDFPRYALPTLMKKIVKHVGIKV